jgi:hypothetical protein
MKKLFVPMRLMIQLEEKGFSENCICGYTTPKGRLRSKVTSVAEGDCNCDWDQYDGEVRAATWGQVFDWLEEKHNLFIHFNKSYTCYNFQIYKYDPYEDENELVVDNAMGDYLKDEYKELAIEEAIKLI